MPDKVKFTVPTSEGLKEYEVPEPSWAVLRDGILPLMRSDLEWYRSRDNDARIAVELVRTVDPSVSYADVEPHLFYRHVQELSASVRRMLTLCGFIPAGEEEATNRSTETSTGSSPT